MALLQQQIPDAYQMAELIYQQTRMRFLKEGDACKLKNEVEKDLAARFIAARNGKVFATKVYHYDANTTAQGEFMQASVGLSATPATDTVEGTDDFAHAAEIFLWEHCNYTHDSDDGTKRPTFMKGMPAYREDDNIDVGTLSPTVFYKVENYGTYDIWYASDSPHPELGLVPCQEAIKSDGTVLPFYVDSSFNSAEGSNGNLYSLPNRAPAYNQSYNNMITNYAKKGTMVQGGESYTNLIGMLFYIIKYGYKSVQKTFAGCTNFNAQPKCAVAETGVKRVLLASATPFYAGCCVSVSGSGLTSAPARGASQCHSTADRVRVKSIEKVTVDSTEYTALNLDLDETITTATDMYVTTMPCFTGETEKVIGHYDGSYLSNTDAHHTFRIKGIEFMNGQWNIESNTMLRKNGNFWEVLIAPKGTLHKANSDAGFVVAGRIPYNAGADYWAGDIIATIDGALFPTSIGGGDSVGIGDRVYAGGTNVADGTLREMLKWGDLETVSIAGFGAVPCWAVLGFAYWYCGSRD